MLKPGFIDRFLLMTEPFDIPMQGLGSFACRRAAWPGFNPRFSGFGGEEGYIHEKFRQAGQRTLCLPFFRWMHRFMRPMGTRYSVKWEDRIRNYAIGYAELGWDDSDLKAHFAELLGDDNAQRIFGDVEKEMSSGFFKVDAIYSLVNEDRTVEAQQMQSQFKILNMDHRIRVERAREAEQNKHLETVIGLRKVAHHLQSQNLNQVLFFPDHIIFDENADLLLKNLLQTLESEAFQDNWSLVRIDGPLDEEFAETDALQSISRDKLDGAYLISASGAELLLNTLSEEKEQLESKLVNLKDWTFNDGQMLQMNASICYS